VGALGTVSFFPKFDGMVVDVSAVFFLAVQDTHKEIASNKPKQLLK
jgi:hypothetical protein